MRKIVSYLCDEEIPSEEEIKECIEIAKNENVLVLLKWYKPYDGWHEKIIRPLDIKNE